MTRKPHLHPLPTKIFTAFIAARGPPWSWLCIGGVWGGRVELWCSSSVETRQGRMAWLSGPSRRRLRRAFPPPRRLLCVQKHRSRFRSETWAEAKLDMDSSAVKKGGGIHEMGRMNSTVDCLLCVAPINNRMALCKGNNMCGTHNSTSSGSLIYKW